MRTTVRTAFAENWTQEAKKTLIAFANSLGGDLYLGANAAGEATGLSLQEASAVMRSVSRFCRSETEPPLSSLIHFQTTPIAGDRCILKISMVPGLDRPYAFLGKRYTGGAYVRDGSATAPATQEELRLMIRESDPIPWETRFCNEEALTFEQAAEVFRRHGAVFSSSLFSELDLTDEHGEFLNLALLLSDQNPSEIVFGSFSPVSNSLSTRRFSGSLLSQIERAGEELVRLNPVFIQKTEALANIRTWPWPPRALEAALIISALQRDYGRPEPAKVSIFSDRFEFLTFGGIPNRLSAEDLASGGVASDATNCRNPKLAAIFQRLGWIEKDGSGSTSLWREYAGSGAEPLLEATRRIFRIVLPRIDAPESKILIERGLDLFKKCDSLSTAEIMERLQISRTSANTIVNRLMLEKSIEKTGAGRSTRYQSLLRLAKARDKNGSIYPP